MFASKNTLYVVGYTVADEADFARLRELLDRHTNALFKVIETQSVLKEFTHDRVIRVEGGHSSPIMDIPDRSCIDRRDTTFDCISNKGASMGMSEMRYAINVCAHTGLVYIHMVAFYFSCNDASGKQHVVKGADWETYKHLQLQ